MWYLQMLINEIKIYLATRSQSKLLCRGEMVDQTPAMFNICLFLHFQRWYHHIDIAQSMMCAISRVHNRHKVVVCFRHATPSPFITMTHDYSYALSTKMLVGYIVSRVCQTWDEFFRLLFCNIWGCMCWTGPFEFRWLKGYIYNPSYYHHQIGSIHLSHCCHIFPWFCVWDGYIVISCHLLHIYPGSTGTLFPLLMFSIWYLQMIRYIMACRSCSFVFRSHHLIIIIMQTYLKALNH